MYNLNEGKVKKQNIRLGLFRSLFLNLESRPHC